MRIRRFPLTLAGAVLLWSCGGRAQPHPATTGPAGSRDGGDEEVAVATGGGQDGGDEDAAVCGDILTDPSNCGACGHDCLGGACSAGACQPVVLVAGLEQPYWMALDDANVYWTEPLTGRIMRVAKAGGAPTVVADGLPSPGEITFNGGNVYWTDSVAGTVNKLDLSGGSPVALASGLLAPLSLAVDGADVYFWTNGDHTLRRLAGSPVVVASGLTVLDMALGTGSLYCSTIDGSILRFPSDGGNAEILAVSQVTYPDSGLSDYSAWGIAVDMTNVYWVDRANWSGLDTARVLSAPVDGGTSTLLCAGCGGAIYITADPSGIYWTDSAMGNIMTLRGGRPAILASAQVGPQPIATDDENVYWVNFGPPGLVNGSPTRGGAVMRVAK
jgi:hypothetical protein